MIASTDQLGRSVEPLFHVLLGLQRAGQIDAAALHQHCCRELEQHQSACRELEVPAADGTDARYALVALLDETALRCDGPLREYWLPRLLQTRFFQENRAGEGFFERLASLRDGAKRPGLLRVYYLCLLLGFRGKYELRGSELELLDIHEGIRSDLQRTRTLPSELVLSPNGRRPQERLADISRNRLLLSLAAICACVATLAYLGMRVSLVHQTDQLLRQISALWS